MRLPKDLAAPLPVSRACSRRTEGGADRVRGAPTRAGRCRPLRARVTYALTARTSFTLDSSTTSRYGRGPAADLSSRGADGPPNRRCAAAAYAGAAPSATPPAFSQPVIPGLALAEEPPARALGSTGPAVAAASRGRTRPAHAHAGLAAVREGFADGLRLDARPAARASCVRPFVASRHRRPQPRRDRPRAAGIGERLVREAVWYRGVQLVALDPAGAPRARALVASARCRHGRVALFSRSWRRAASATACCGATALARSAMLSPPRPASPPGLRRTDRIAYAAALRPAARESGLVSRRGAARARPLPSRRPALALPAQARDDRRLLALARLLVTIARAARAALGYELAGGRGAAAKAGPAAPGERRMPAAASLARGVPHRWACSSYGRRRAPHRDAAARSGLRAPLVRSAACLLPAGRVERASGAALPRAARRAGRRRAASRWRRLRAGVSAATSLRGEAATALATTAAHVERELPCGRGLHARRGSRRRRGAAGGRGFIRRARRSATGLRDRRTARGSLDGLPCGIAARLARTARRPCRLAVLPSRPPSVPSPLLIVRRRLTSPSCRAQLATSSPSQGSAAARFCRTCAGVAAGGGADRRPNARQVTLLP